MPAVRNLTNWLLRLRPFLVFVPAVFFMLIWGLGRVAPAQGFALFLAGLLAWTLLEYVLHRAMHIPPLFRGMGWVQAFHLGHHQAPEDLEHAVISLRGSIPLAFLFFGFSYLIFWDLPWAILFLAGLITGYLFYESVHLVDHARVHWPVVRQLMRYHARHHFQDEHRTFGVTTPLWDWVFGTLPRGAKMGGPAGPEPVLADRRRPLHA